MKGNAAKTTMMERKGFPSVLGRGGSQSPGEQEKVPRNGLRAPSGAGHVPSGQLQPGCAATERGGLCYPPVGQRILRRPLVWKLQLCILYLYNVFLDCLTLFSTRQVIIVAFLCRRTDGFDFAIICIVS